MEKVRTFEIYEDSLSIYCDSARALGIEWRISVEFKKYKDSNQKEDKYIGIFLFANQKQRIS